MSVIQLIVSCTVSLVQLIYSAADRLCAVAFSLHYSL